MAGKHTLEILLLGGLTFMEIIIYSYRDASMLCFRSLNSIRSCTTEGEKLYLVQKPQRIKVDTDFSLGTVRQAETPKIDVNRGSVCQRRPEEAVRFCLVVADPRRRASTRLSAAERRGECRMS